MRNSNLIPRNQFGSNIQSLADYILGRDFFSETFDKSLWSTNTSGEFVPKLNISETDSNYKVVAELPGLEEKDFEVTVEDNILRIKGEKKFETQNNDEHYHRYESSYGSFERVLRLPEAVDSDQSQASFKNGVLTLTIPKDKKSSKVKKLQISSS